MIDWRVRTFETLTKTELFDVASERIKTFVVEQHRPYLELDATDQTARHLLGYQNGQLVAYARLFTVGDHVTFGRVLTTQAVRGQGVGRQLMHAITTQLSQHYAGRPVVIEAQVDKQHFYEKFGYQAVGTSFLFNQTPHIKMTHPALTK